jgi:hypothetical protein
MWINTLHKGDSDDDNDGSSNNNDNVTTVGRFGKKLHWPA